MTARVAGGSGSGAVGVLCRRAACAAAFAAALFLAGCTVVPRADVVAPGSAISGRIAVRVEGERGAAPHSVSAAFELQGDADVGQLNLSTPLGSVLAQARWTPGQVVLATPRGERRFGDLDALTRELLGESLPVAALFDWLRGRPWPGAASAPAANGFEQLGWRVDMARFDAGAVDAERLATPAVTVKARLDGVPR